MRIIQFREAICEAMSEEMRRDESIYLMGEEVAEYNGAYKASKGMLDEFGEKRVIDTPISELGFAGIGVGSTMTGNRPIIEFMTFNFALVGIDQIINNAAKIRQMSGGQFPCPIVFRGPTASAGQLAATHSQAFESWYANCPGLKVIVPANPYDAKGLLIQSIRDNDPVLFCEHKMLYEMEGEFPEEPYSIPFGEANFIREGDDVTIVAIGRMVQMASQAADILAKEGIQCEIVDPRTTSPLDEDSILESVEKTGRLVVVDESGPRCGMAADIASLVATQAFDDLKAPIQTVTPPHTPVPFSDYLEDLYIPNSERVIEAVKNIVTKK